MKFWYNIYLYKLTHCQLVTVQPNNNVFETFLKNDSADYTIYMCKH